MAKKAKAKPVARKAADEIEEIINQDIICDMTLPWDDSVSQLEQLAEFCTNWAATIKGEHEDE